MKKTPEVIIILQILSFLCDVWFLKYGVQRTDFLSYWTSFYPFTSLTDWKIKILKKWKKHLEILSFYVGNINYNHLMYGYWDTKHNREFFVNLDHLLHFYPATALTITNGKRQLPSLLPLKRKSLTAYFCHRSFTYNLLWTCLYFLD